MELSLTVALVGMLAATPLPRFNTSAQSSVRAKSLAHRLTSDLRLTRSLAITHRTPYILSIDSLSSSYTIYKNAVASGNRVQDTKTFDSTIAVSQDTSFTFVSTGSLDPASGQMVTVTCGVFQWQLVIVPATGRVKLSKL